MVKRCLRTKSALAKGLLVDGQRKNDKNRVSYIIENILTLIFFIERERSNDI